MCDMCPPTEQEKIDFLKQRLIQLNQQLPKMIQERDDITVYLGKKEHICQKKWWQSLKDSIHKEGDKLKEKFNSSG